MLDNNAMIPKDSVLYCRANLKPSNSQFENCSRGATSVIRLSNAAYVSDVQNLIAESTFQQIEKLGEIWNIQKKTF